MILFLSPCISYKYPKLGPLKFFLFDFYLFPINIIIFFLIMIGRITWKISSIFASLLASFLCLIILKAIFSMKGPLLWYYQHSIVWWPFQHELAGPTVEFNIVIMLELCCNLSNNSLVLLPSQYMPSFPFQFHFKLYDPALLVETFKNWIFPDKILLVAVMYTEAWYSLIFAHLLL